MIAREFLEPLYTRFGRPNLTNFVLSDLREDVEYAFGAFALVDHHGNAVLIRRKPIKEHPGIENYWWIPGGAREADEQLDQTAMRELEEETGLRISINHILLAHIPQDRPSFIAVTFRGRVLDGAVSPTADPDRVTLEARAFPPHGVPFDRIWMDQDKILLVEEGFTTGSIGDLIAKNGLKHSLNG